MNTDLSDNQNMPIPGPPTPLTAAQLLCQMVPIDLKVDEHAIQFAFIRGILKTDEARKMDAVVNEALHLRLDEHEQAGAQVAAQQQQLAMVANGPQMALQQNEQNKQTSLAQKDKQADTEHQAGQAAEDRSHKMELQDRKLANDREVAKMKATDTRAAKR